LIYKFITEGES